VFTPAYNRAYCLARVYESLLKQINQNFVWLIVDDGSTDNTKELVAGWVNEQKLVIKYIYKANGGMHTAHNAAYKNIETELNVCIDSDDFMPISAIQNMFENWQKVKDDEAIAGLVGLDETIDGNLIGTKFKNEFIPTTLIDFYYTQGGAGDKKLVLRNKLTKAYPSYPEYPEERLVPLDTLYVLICRDYKLMPVNQIWCTVDYQQDGSSATIINQYFKSPKGFRYAREISMKYSNVFKLKLRNAIHYNISSFIIGDKLKIIFSPVPLFTILCAPLSYVCFLYLKNKNNRR
jgi:glycosyltransferase involved in cell wall biosynthesis